MAAFDLSLPGGIWVSANTDGEFLGDAQAGAGPSPPLQDQAGGDTRYYRVY